MSAANQPDAGASLPVRDLEDIARDLFAACGPFDEQLGGAAALVLLALWGAS